MSAALSRPRLLVSSATATYVLVFVALLLFETPDLGIGRFFMLAIALLALGTNARIGAAGGVIATALYVIGFFMNPALEMDNALTLGTITRSVTFISVGALVGWFANTNRIVLRALETLAERDSLTRLPNSRSFAAAVTRRVDAARPFALLLADVDSLRQVNAACGDEAGDGAIRDLADVLARSVRADDEVARIGGDEFGVLVSLEPGGDATRTVGSLERTLATTGCGATFGWSIYPEDGITALALYLAANQRLCARKIVRGGGPLRVVSRANTFDVPHDRFASTRIPVA